MVFQNNHYHPSMSQLFHEGATAAQNSILLPLSQGINHPRRLLPSSVVGVYPSCEGFASLDATYNDNDDNNNVPYFGMMFSVDALDQPLSITTLELDLRSDLALNEIEEAALVTVYMHRGEYMSVVHGPGAWTMVANSTAKPLTDTVTGAVTSHVIPVQDFSNIRMAPHSRLSLYVTMNGPYLDNTVIPADPWETNGRPQVNSTTASNNSTDSRFSTVAQDQYLIVHAGAGFSAPDFPPDGIDASSMPRFAGKVHYQVANTCPHLDDDDSPAPTNLANETGNGVTTTAVHYYYMANKALSEPIYSAIEAGINNVLNDALETNQDLARFRIEYGLTKAVGSVTAIPAAVSAEEQVQCPLPEWAACPVVIGAAHLTHSSRLSEEELLYHLYSLTGQINEVIRMYELQDTTILYIGFKDVGVNFRLVLQNVPQDQRLTADQTDFVSSVLRAYLNATMPSKSKVLMVTIQDQPPSPQNSGTRGLRRGAPSNPHRLLTNDSIFDREPVGNVTVVGTLLGLERSYATGNEYLQDVKESFTNGQERLLQFLQQQLLLPGVIQAEVNGIVPADYFEHVVALELTGLRLYNAPGAAADDDEPLPDESSTSSSNRKGGQRMKLTAFLGVAVAMVVVLFVALLAAKEHVCCFFGNKDALKENAQGKHSDTEADGVGALPSTRPPSSPPLSSVDVGGEAPTTPGVVTQLQLPQSAARQAPERSRSHDADLITSIRGNPRRCAPARAYSTSHVVEGYHTPGRGCDAQRTPGVLSHPSPFEHERSYQKLGPSLAAPSSAGSRGLQRDHSRRGTYGGGNGTEAAGLTVGSGVPPPLPTTAQGIPSNRTLPARCRSVSLTGVAATGARGVVRRTLSLDLVPGAAPDGWGPAPRSPIVSESMLRADKDFLDPAAVAALGDSRIAGQEAVPSVVSFPTDHSGTAFVGGEVRDEDVVSEDRCAGPRRSNRSGELRGPYPAEEDRRHRPAKAYVHTVPQTPQLQRQASQPSGGAGRRSMSGQGLGGHGTASGSNLERSGSARSRRSDSWRSHQSSMPPASAVEDAEATDDADPKDRVCDHDPDFAPSCQPLTRTRSVRRRRSSSSHEESERAGVLDAPGTGRSVNTQTAPARPPSSDLPPPPQRLHRDHREGRSAAAATATTATANVAAGKCGPVPAVSSLPPAPPQRIRSVRGCG